MTRAELIARAGSVVHAYRNGDHTVADVGCALITDGGAVHTGVCIDAPSGPRAFPVQVESLEPTRKALLS